MKRMIVILLVLIIAKLLNAETFEILTYYPVPCGIFSHIEVIGQQEGDTLNNAEIDIAAHGRSNVPILSFKKSVGTLSVPEDILEGYLGAIKFDGYFKGEFNTLAIIMAESKKTVFGYGGDMRFFTYRGDLIFSPITGVSSGLSLTSGLTGEATSPPLSESTNSSDIPEVMRITKDGNVGIGTKTPKADRLDIVSTANSKIAGVENIPVRIRNTNKAKVGTGIAFSVGEDDNFVGAKIIHERTDVKSKGDLVFLTKPDSDPGDTTTEKMRIKSGNEVEVSGEITVKGYDGSGERLTVHPVLTNVNTLCLKNQAIYTPTGTPDTGTEVKLPSYVKNIVKLDTINIQITSKGPPEVFSVKEDNITDDKFTVVRYELEDNGFTKGNMQFYWVFTAELKDEFFGSE